MLEMSSGKRGIRINRKKTEFWIFNFIGRNQENNKFVVGNQEIIKVESLKNLSSPIAKDKQYE